MSGFRNKKPDDIIKNRQEYLDNLNTVIQLQDANEQAVKLYKETGQLPPITQMKDNRTVEDKLRDYEKLKISIREDLAPIASSQLANMIINKIENSPFNQDNGLLVFFAQRAEDFVKNIARSYKFGIKGDENDAVQFVNFIEKFYNDKNSLSSNAKQFMARLGTNTQASLSKKASQQAETLNRLEAEINRITTEIDRAVRADPQFNTLRNTLAKISHTITLYIDLIKYIYPSELVYKKAGQQDISLQQIEEAFNNIMISRTFTAEQDALANEYKNFLEYINHNIPNTDFVNTLIEKLNRYSKIFIQTPNRLNADNIIEALDNIFSVVNSGEDLNYLENVKASLDYILSTIAQPIPIGLVQARRPVPIIPTAPTAPTTPTTPIVSGMPEITEGEADEGIVNGHGLKSIIRIKGIQRIQGGSIQPIPRRSIFKHQLIDPTEGMQPDPRYIKFGRYLINTKRLKDDILSLRRDKGTPIASLPNYKMSKPFVGIIKKIIGGSLPTKEDFNDLSDDEKRYFLKVSKEADLSHKLDIPTPSKDEDEKDIHNFNVYKGEIMAGNDNKEMIKKFKLLLIKLSRNNTINKHEATEILEMLTHAGY